MLDQITNHIYELAGVAIAAAGAVRFYYGPQKFREVPWQPLRRVFIPIAHKVAERSLGAEYYAAYQVSRGEHAATLETDPEAVIEDLEAAGYVPEPLAAFKKNWNGHGEIASYARHRGPKPFPGAPEWLRERQVHVTLFEHPAGGTIVTSHYEYNSWRFDLAEKHHQGVDMDVQLGRKLAAADLGIELETPPEP